MKTKFKGIIPALLTPFDIHNQIDFELLGKYLTYLVKDVKVDGLYVCGSTSEAFLLSYEEKHKILTFVFDYVRNQLKSNLFLIAQIGCLNIFEVQKLALEARKIGYDAISSVFPYYYKYSFQEIHKWYDTLTSYTDLPFFIYYLPALSHMSVTLEQFHELLSLKNVIGVKYSSDDLFFLSQLIADHRDKVFLFGVDELLMHALNLKVDGAIGSTYNLFGKQAKAIYHAVFKHDHVSALKISEEYNKFLAMALQNGIYQNLKAGLNLLLIGQKKVYCRFPLAQITINNYLIAEKIIKFNEQFYD